MLLCTLVASLAAIGQAPAQVTFTQVTQGPLVTTLGRAVGCAWGDFRNSGFQDLVVCGYGPGTNVYYQNAGNGTFTKNASGEPVADIDYHISAGTGDYDNDGHPDLFVTAGAYAPSARPNKLYHNNGDGTFSALSGGSVTNLLGHFGPGSWVDYDHDGFLDLFIPNHGFANDNGSTNLLYHNNSDGTFSPINSGSIVSDIGVGFCSTWQDYDNGGHEDLLVLNRSANAVNFLYHNNGDGTFTRITNGIIATDIWSQGASCCAWGDYNNDGLPDLFVTDASGTRNQLYNNLGQGVFVRATSGPELVPPSGVTFNGCAWGDYDNDGYLDLFVSANDGPNALFHNNGDGTFTQVLTGQLGGGPITSCGAVSWVDYDNDGFLDLFVGVANVGGTPASSLLYHNKGNTNGWLEIKLIGTVANRSAIGAKVRVQATIAGKTFWQLRELNAGGGYNDQPLVAHFGLGDATNVSILRIEWPSDTVQEFQNVAPRQILTITEPPRLLASRAYGVPQFSLKAWPGMQFIIQSSSDLSGWTPTGAITITNLNGIGLILDTNPPASDARFYRAVGL